MSTKPKVAHKKSKVEQALEEMGSPTPPVEAEPVNVFPPPAPSTETISKTEAIRRALAAGVEKPTSGVEWIKTRFGLTVTPATFSTTKMEIKKKAGTSVGRSARSPVYRSVTQPVSTFDLIRTVKSLIDAHGADSVRQAVDLFAT
jgi:hypothetical protein